MQKNTINVFSSINFQYMAALSNLLFMHTAKFGRTRALFSSSCWCRGLKKNQILPLVALRKFCKQRQSILMEKSIASARYQWNPGSIINVAIKDNICYACVVLNRRILIPASVTQNIWQNASIRCTVDGGTNRWRDFLRTHCQGKEMKVPDFITGDFDSITEETSKFFSDPAIKRVHTPDQNATDFTKSIGVIRPLLLEQDKSKTKNIIVFHDTSGRLDQIMANINTLYKVQNESVHVYLLSGNSITWLLRPGKHSIKIPSDLVEQKRWCALIPIGKKANCVTTHGLQWNIVGGVMEFGGMVSTSNTYDSECIDIETDSCLLWSMGLFSFHDD